jgi:Uma2 family endonuclease
MAAAVRAEFHGIPHGRVVTWLGGYADATPGIEVIVDSSVRVDDRNEPRPDVVLRIANEGTSVIDSDGYLVGPPELVAEVSASSASYDLHEKLAVYERHGVREYLVWRVMEKEFDWFVRRGGSYVRLESGEGGVLRSEIYPGLWLNVAALLRGDGLTVRSVLEQGLSATQHADFAAQLERRKS